MTRVYVAGGLFNAGERYEQEKITRLLEQAGYTTFLPQRDGFELGNLLESLISGGQTPEEAKQTANQMIFDYDVYQVYSADAIVSNSLGTEPDSGTVSVTALAFGMGKAVVIFNDDIRVFSAATQLNPLFGNLSTVPVVTQFDGIVSAVKQSLLINDCSIRLTFFQLAYPLQVAISRGSQLNPKQII